MRPSRPTALGQLETQGTSLLWAHVCKSDVYRRGSAQAVVAVEFVVDDNLRASLRPPASSCLSFDTKPIARAQPQPEYGEDFKIAIHHLEEVFQTQFRVTNVY